MMLNKLLFKYKSLKRSIVSINWDISWKEEKIYLKQLIIEREGLPKEGVYDSIYQYKAQTYKKNFLEKFVLQIVSLFAFLFLVIKYQFSFVKKSYEDFDVAYFYKKDIFNPALIGSKKLVFIELNQGYLSLKDFRFICLMVWKTKFNFIIMSTVVYRLAQSSFAIKKYSCKELWVNMEYSCASGILKDYCNIRDVELNNFMHGEKIFTLRDAFSSFDKFYVWNQEYLNMFRVLNSNSELIVCNPWITIAFDLKKSICINKRAICYFFKGVESDNEIAILQDCFDQLRVVKGYEVYVKDHPRHAVVSKKFRNVVVVDKNINIKSLYSSMEYLCAQYSTILTECEMLGINYLVDDISNILLATKLKERGYLMAQNSNLLSKFINEKVIL